MVIEVIAPVDNKRLKTALNMIHWLEDRARGLHRMNRVEAYCEVRGPLNCAERKILRNTLKIEDEEVGPDSGGVL